MNRRRLLAGLAAMALSTGACTALPAVTPSASRPASDTAAATPGPVNPALVNPAPVNPSTALAVQLPNRGPAPELTNEIWINSPPLRLEDLRGQVVIVEFWTYG